jgi:hypothetical protein
MLYTMRKMRKSQMELSDTIFWLLSSIALVVLSIFPQLAFVFARLTGIHAPLNFVLVSIIFVTLLKIFSLSVEVSQLKIKLRSLIQEYGIRDNDNRAILEKRLRELEQAIKDGKNETD